MLPDYAFIGYYSKIHINSITPENIDLIKLGFADATEARRFLDERKATKHERDACKQHLLYYYYQESLEGYVCSPTRIDTTGVQSYYPSSYLTDKAVSVKLKEILKR